MKLIEMQKFHVSLKEATEQLKSSENCFTELLQHSTMKLEYFAPDKIDTQTTHKQDELYIIIKGSGKFERKGERIIFSAGDVIFVPTGMEHRFQNFTDDFATCVVFYGPEGGET